MIQTAKASANFFNITVSSLIMNLKGQVVKNCLEVAETAVSLYRYDLLPGFCETLEQGGLHYAALYYRALYKNHCSVLPGLVHDAFETVALYGPPEYRAKALLALASTHSRHKDFDEARRWFARFFRFHDRHPQLSSVTKVIALDTISTIESFEGERFRSLATLETLEPQARLLSRTFPTYYLNVLNSLAAANLECGRIEEASRIIELPRRLYVPGYEEWLETAREIDERRRRSDRVFVMKQALKPIPKKTIAVAKQQPPAPAVRDPKAVDAVRRISSYSGTVRSKVYQDFEPREKVGDLLDVLTRRRDQERTTLLRLSDDTFKEFCHLIRRIQENPTEADRKRLEEINRILTTTQLPNEAKPAGNE